VGWLSSVIRSIFAHRHDASPEKKWKTQHQFTQPKLSVRDTAKTAQETHYARQVALSGSYYTGTITATSVVYCSFTAHIILYHDETLEQNIRYTNLHTHSTLQL
jgi:hypothetical protein